MSQVSTRVLWNSPMSRTLFLHRNHSCAIPAQLEPGALPKGEFAAPREKERLSQEHTGCGSCCRKCLHPAGIHGMESKARTKLHRARFAQRFFIGTARLERARRDPLGRGPGAAAAGSVVAIEAIVAIETIVAIAAI